ncbi:MAG: DEAD/DEAH box helicase family protein, partial [Bacteroidetes bacterium]|nr:DEAD/DEAH box helicase family protein [Bacteroidota bacterium]
MPEPPQPATYDDDQGVNELSESQFEATTVRRLRLQGYVHKSGAALRGDGFGPRDVVHTETLRAVLAKQYPHLDDQALAAATSRLASPDGVDLMQRNRRFHQMMTRGIEVPYERPDGSTAHEHVYPIQWDDPEANRFWVVQQLAVEGRSPRRPDLVVYVNGLPLVVVELKNPYDEDADVVDAYKQLENYQLDVPQLFDHNAFCVISDGVDTRCGPHSAALEWFSPWKSIDGRTVEDAATGSMKTLVEGLFPKARLLEYIRHFIVHEQAGGGIVKKAARYHQYFGVRFAVERAERAVAPEGDRKIGVIWHTQGSGKSLSMVFFVGILRQHLGNPTIVVEVDRNDLDEQLYDSFVAA